jgi:hypothetical protein
LETCPIPRECYRVAPRVGLALGKKVWDSPAAVEFLPLENIIFYFQQAVQHRLRDWQDAVHFARTFIQGYELPVTVKIRAEISLKQGLRN